MGQHADVLLFLLMLLFHNSPLTLVQSNILACKNIRNRNEYEEQMITYETGLRTTYKTLTYSVSLSRQLDAAVLQFLHPLLQVCFLLH